MEVITSYHIISHHITSYHITSHHITSHHITSYHITSHHTTSHHRRSMKCVSFISWKVVCKSSNALPRHSSPSSRSVVLIDQSNASVMLFPCIVTSAVTVTILWFNLRTLSHEFQASIELRVMFFFFFLPFLTLTDASRAEH